MSDDDLKYNDLEYIFVGDYSDVPPKYTGIVKFLNDDRIKTFKNGELHSFEDRPSAHDRYYDCWHMNDCLHRENNKPAYITYDDFGTPVRYKYYINGMLHRTDGPAIVCAYGNEHYYLYNKPIDKASFKCLLDLFKLKSCK